MPIFTGGQREPLRLPDIHVQDELGVLPHVELPDIDIEGAATNVTQSYIVTPDDELRPQSTWACCRRSTRRTQS